MHATKAVTAAALATVLMFGVAGAQDQPPLQGPSGGSMMGAWGPGEMMGRGGAGMMGFGGMGPWMMGWGAAGQAMCNAMASHIDGRLAFIKAELKITEAQEPLWAAYAGAARDNALAMRAHCTAMMTRRNATQANLPDRLDQHEQLMAAQLEAIRAMNKALKPLYAALGESQRQAADQLFWGPMGMM